MESKDEIITGYPIYTGILIYTIIPSSPSKYPGFKSETKNRPSTFTHSLNPS